VTFNASGTLLLSGWDDGTVRCFLPESGALKWEQYDASGGGVNVVVGTNCGTKFVTGGADSQIRLWRIFEKGVELQGLVSEHAGEITSIMLSKNDEEAVSSSLDGSCIVWDMTKFSRKQIIMANSLFMAVKSVTLPMFPDRPFVGPLATLDQTQMPARFWDSLQTPPPPPLCCNRYRPDEAQLLTVGTDRKVAYWETYDGTLIREVEVARAGAVKCLDISADGQKFVTGGEDKLLKVRRLPTLPTHSLA
jgi:WD40 repeat protein